MNQRRVLTKVLGAAALLYGMSRLEGRQAFGEEPGSAGAPPVEIAAAASAGPDIYFAEKTFNFGNIVQDEKVQHTFQFENRGNAPLEIGDVRGSCGCTAALASAKTVAPGATGSIEVTFDSRGKHGKQQKTISVSSNDPDSPTTTLMLEGSIATLLEMDPGFVSFGNGLPRGKPVVQKVRLWRPDGQAFQITSITSDSPSVTGKAEGFSADGKTGQELTLTLSAAAEPGRVSGAVRVETDIPQVKEQTVRFFGSVNGDVSVVPKYAILGTVPVGESASKTIVIQTSPEAPALQILNVANPSASLKTELKTVKEGRTYELTVSINKDAPKGSLRCEIVLETNLPSSEKSLKIPVYGFVGNEGDTTEATMVTEPGQ